jgi:Family of unknown function (DUF5670)
MLWAMAMILVVLWAVGFFAMNAFGGFIHLLLLVAAAVILIDIVEGRRKLV